MRALFFATVLSVLPPMAMAQETTHQSEAAIAGTYAVSGRNPDGSAYTGTVVLRQQGADYNIAWSIAGQDYQGTGRLEGRVLTVNWQGDSNPVVYVLMPDGELHGTWADGHALDRLAPQR
ncbi:LIC10280 family protein [Antarctobacter jejuensis]|uniref:LIC10280 family protein n=1 Tax=Antarctobacter jejuensis TaxID=1439938 RepID=UPI003FD1A0B9